VLIGASCGVNGAGLVGWGGARGVGWCVRRRHTKVFEVMLLFVACWCWVLGVGVWCCHVATDNSTGAGRLLVRVLTSSRYVCTLNTSSSSRVRCTLVATPGGTVLVLVAAPTQGAEVQPPNNMALFNVLNML
jgi:hypothetical protein